jgi:hypothetical protein
VVASSPPPAIAMAMAAPASALLKRDIDAPLFSVIRWYPRSLGIPAR